MLRSAAFFPVLVAVLVLIASATAVCDEVDLGDARKLIRANCDSGSSQCTTDCTNALSDAVFTYTECFRGVSASSDRDTECVNNVANEYGNKLTNCASSSPCSSACLDSYLEAADALSTCILRSLDSTNPGGLDGGVKTPDNKKGSSSSQSSQAAEETTTVPALLLGTLLAALAFLP
mmetsp:Transcript_8918/g.22420  ORF Transcript_8918/g.22420 Transcript_8918/m.22420 type:complete len:177 (+) Transcript_8918:55-585(+)